MLIFDAHSDILADIARKRLKGQRDVFNTRHLPGLTAAGINAMIAVVWLDGCYDKSPGAGTVEVLQHGFAEVKNLNNVTFPVRNHKELKEAVSQGKLAMILGLEGLNGLEGDSERLHFFHELGVRHASLTWNFDNEFATGARSESTIRGLSSSGKDVVRLIEKLGIMLDVSHADEKTFWDICDVYNGPILASHSNSYSICPHPRNLTDAQIKAVKDCGGVIGLNSYHGFIGEGKVGIDQYIDHISYMVEKAGIDHVAFGFDFCGFLHDSPEDADYEETALATVDLADFHGVNGLLKRMKERGYDEDDLTKISFLNMENLFKHVAG